MCSSKVDIGFCQLDILIQHLIWWSQLFEIIFLRVIGVPCVHCVTSIVLIGEMSIWCHPISCFVTHYSSLVVWLLAIIVHLVHLVIMSVEVTFRESGVVTTWNCWMGFEIFIVSILKILIIPAESLMVLLCYFVKGRSSLLRRHRSCTLVIMSALDPSVLISLVIVRCVMLFRVYIRRFKDIPVSIELFLIVRVLLEQRLHWIYRDMTLKQAYTFRLQED